MSLLPIAQWMASQAGTTTEATLTGTTRLRYALTPVASGELRIKSPTLALDPGGAARVLNLPPASQALSGMRLAIINTADADEALNIVDDTVSASAVSLASITENEVVELLCGSGGPGGYRWWNLGVGGNT